MLGSRTNTSLLGRWWWTIDRVTLFAVVFLIGIGLILVAAASPPVAVRIGLDPFYFVHRHQLFLLLALGVIFVVSLLSPLYVRRLAAFGLLISLALLVLVLMFGIEVKGARRWISVGGISLQPSEFLKPCFAVVMAWICAEKHRRVGFPGNWIVIGLYGLILLLLALQPDFGMIVTVSATWAIQFFLAGLHFFWVILLIVLGVAGVWGAYHLFPHVARRIDSFLDPRSGDNFQVAKSLEAIRNGGVFGRGPGEGEVKKVLPDSHTDFVFAVAGEEFGIVVCMMILCLFAFVVLRGLARVWRETDLFIVLAVAGLVAQFGIQAIINMGVAVELLPAKGMTLPFLSYGGSSVLAVALGMGMIMALTRRRYGQVR